MCLVVEFAFGPVAMGNLLSRWWGVRLSDFKCKSLAVGMQGDRQPPVTSCALLCPKVRHQV